MWSYEEGWQVLEKVKGVHSGHPGVPSCAAESELEGVSLSHRAETPQSFGASWGGSLLAELVQAGPLGQGYWPGGRRWGGDDWGGSGTHRVDVWGSLAGYEAQHCPGSEFGLHCMSEAVRSQCEAEA